MTNAALIDWVSFTLPTAYTTETIQPVIQDIFKIEFYHFESANGGKKGFYKNHYIYYSETGKALINVLITPNTERNQNTTAFFVTGYALSCADDALHVSAIDIIKSVAAMHGKFTRYDLAIDDRSGVPILEQMIDASNPAHWRDRIITPLRFKKPVAIWDESIYFGSRRTSKQSTFIRAYDKAKEQSAEAPWFRCELSTTNRDLCHNITDKLLQNVPVSQITSALLSEYLKFVPPGRKNKYKREVCKWWNDFLHEAAGYEFHRVAGGKINKSKPPPDKNTFVKYCRDYLNRDKTGKIEDAILQLAAEISAGREWNN